MPEAAREYGPGCTPELIGQRIAKFPNAYPCCSACLDHGALYHAQIKKRRVNEDVETQEAKAEGGHAQG